MPPAERFHMVGSCSCALDGRAYLAPQSSMGVVHRRDSRLFIANDPQWVDDESPWYMVPAYYALDGTEFREVE